MSWLTTTTHSRHSSSDGEGHQDVAMDDYEYEVGHKAVAVPATEHTSTLLLFYRGIYIPVELMG